MRNLTPHAVVVSVAGTVEVIQPSGTVARVSTTDCYGVIFCSC